MDSSNMTHPFRRVFGTLDSDRAKIVFCSWNADDCADKVQAQNVSQSDCIAVNFDLTAEDLVGSLCCKSVEEVPFITNLPVCSTQEQVKVAILIALLAIIIIVCAKSIHNMLRIFLKFGFLSLRNSVGKCAFVCALAQLFAILYIVVLIFGYVAILSGATFGEHSMVNFAVVITLPITFSFVVFSALSMAFNIIAVCRNATMQGHDQKDRNEKRLTRLHRIILAVTIVYSILFFAVAFFLGALGNYVILGSTLLVSIFQTWLFRSAALLMQDLNSSIGNDTSMVGSRTRSDSEFEVRNLNQNTFGDKKMRNSLQRLQWSSNFISKASAICAIILLVRLVDEFVRLEGALGFNPVRFVSAILQNVAILIYMFILNSITSTLYMNKIGPKKRNDILSHNSTLVSETEYA